MEEKTPEMKEKIQKAVKFFNSKFTMKNNGRDGFESSQKRYVRIRVGAAAITKNIVVDLYCERTEVFEELKNIIKSDKGMNDIYKEVSDSRCFTVENQSIEEQCKLIEKLYDKWQQKY